MKVSPCSGSRIERILIFLKEYIDKQTFIIVMRPDLARYTDRDDNDLDSISEQGPKEVLWVSFNMVYFFGLTIFF